MEEVILDKIPLDVDMAALMKKLHVKEESKHAEELKKLVEDARQVARPKAFYRVAYIESRGDDHVIIEGTTFKSRVLCVNLAKAHRVFPFVVTCGEELEDWPGGQGDMLRRFWVDTLKEMALRKAMAAFKKDLEARCRPGRTAAMSPGSLEDWPITQQGVLFALLGKPETSVGVRLSDSCLMIPVKSLSGIRFPTEEPFESCRLCPREKCPGRRAPYDRTLYERKYEKKA